jgi:hypothetical protein
MTFLHVEMKYFTIYPSPVTVRVFQTDIAIDSLIQIHQNILEIEAMGSTNTMGQLENLKIEAVGHETQKGTGPLKVEGCHKVVRDAASCREGSQEAGRSCGRP